MGHQSAIIPVCTMEVHSWTIPGRCRNIVKYSKKNDRVMGVGCYGIVNRVTMDTYTMAPTLTNINTYG